MANQQETDNMSSALSVLSQLEIGPTDDQLANAAFPEEKVAQDTQEPQDPKDTQEPQEPQETKKTQDLPKSEFYAKLSEKDAKIRDLQHKLKDLSSNDLSELAKKDPMSVLSKLGIKFEDLLNKWAEIPEDIKGDSKSVNNSNIDIDERVNNLVSSKIKELESKFETKTAREKEFRKIESLIAGNDSWELISKHGESGLQLVLETATEYYKRTGEIPAYNDVLDYVESSYRDTYKKEIERLKNFNAFKNMFGQAEQKPVVVNPQPSEFVKQSQTLGERYQSTQTPGEPSARDRYLSALRILSEAEKE